MSPLTAWWNPWRTRSHPWAGGAGPPPSTTPCPSTCSTSSSVPAGRGTPSWYSTGKSSAAKWPSPSRPTSSTATRRPRPQRRGVYIQPEVFLGPEGSDADWPWDTIALLDRDNVNQEALLSYAREEAVFSTHGQLSNMECSVNHYGQADVAMPLHRSETARSKSLNIKNTDCVVKTNHHLTRERVTCMTIMSSDEGIRPPHFVFNGKHPDGVKTMFAEKGSYRLETMMETSHAWQKKW